MFFQGSTPFTCRTLLCSFNLGGGKTVPCDLGTVCCLKQPLTLELEEENNQKVSLEKALKLFSRANYSGGTSHTAGMGQPVPGVGEQAGPSSSVGKAYLVGAP